MKKKSMIPMKVKIVTSKKLIKTKKTQNTNKEGKFETYSKKLVDLVSVSKNMFILILIFEQSKNFIIQNKAIKLLIDSLSQRKIFCDEIVKIELIVSENENQNHK